MPYRKRYVRKRARVSRRKAVRPRRRTRRVRRKVATQNFYTRTFFHRVTVPTSTSSDTISRQLVKLTELSGGDELAGNFHQYRFKFFRLTVRPKFGFTSSNFSFGTNHPYISSAKDVFGSFSGSTIEGLMNMQYPRRSNVNFHMRKGRPQLNTRHTSEPSNISYDVTRTPWIDCDDSTPSHYMCTLGFPSNTNGATTPAAQDFEVEAKVTIQFRGKRDPTQS